MLVGNFREGKGLILEVMEDIMVSYDRDKHWKDAAEEKFVDRGGKGGIMPLGETFKWDILGSWYKREFWLAFPYPKGENIVWTCGKDSNIGGRRSTNKLDYAGSIVNFLKKGGLGVLERH